MTNTLDSFTSYCRCCIRVLLLHCLVLWHVWGKFHFRLAGFRANLNVFYVLQNVLPPFLWHPTLELLMGTKHNTKVTHYELPHILPCLQLAAHLTLPSTAQAATVVMETILDY